MVECRIWVLLLVFAIGATAQSVAIVTPTSSDLDKSIASNIRAAMSGAVRVQDPDMTAAGFAASGVAGNAFNMSSDEARRLASVLGSDFFIVIRSGTQRRVSLNKPDYYESFASLYLVSGRTGRLIDWKLQSKDGGDRNDSEHRLVSSLIYDELFEAMLSASKAEATESRPAAIEEVPTEGTAAAKNFRPPVPYRRLKPEYPHTAYLYDVTATVEATVDLDEKGNITRAAITRWAGYGLDESVLTVIRSMNWRSAERAGKPLPIRFLLRYNFKKLEKADPIDE